MKCRITALYIYIFLSAGLSVSQADSLKLHKIREPGDSLDISIQQELDHAADIGIQWLKANQNPDGSWGSSNKLASTAICALALASQNDPSLTSQVQSAMQFIKKICSDNMPTNLPAIAWTTAALIVTETQTCAVELLCRKLKEPDGAVSAADSTLRREIILGLRLAEPDAVLRKTSAEHYKTASQKLNSDTLQMLQIWFDSRVINREGSGQLINAQGQRVDWRRTFAQKIISSQKIAPEGGGFWQGQNRSPSLRNTATAILISKEL